MASSDALLGFHIESIALDNYRVIPNYDAINSFICLAKLNKNKLKAKDITGY